MKLLRYIALALAAITALLPAAAQSDQVQWTTTVETTGPHSGAIVWTAVIADGWHIYGDNEISQPTVLTVEPQHGVELVGPVTPTVEPEIHTDEALAAKLPWWEGTVSFRQEFTLAPGMTGATLRGTIAYMVCTPVACTRPVTEPYEVTFGTPAPAVSDDADDAAEPAQAVVAADLETGGSLWDPVDLSHADDNIDAVSSAAWWVILGFGFLGGLLALLTPCVWPMIPMTVSFFLKKGKSRRRAIADAITYAAAIIVIYLVLGLAITGIFGAGKLNEVATGAVFNVLFFVLLVVFAISFFGAFDIKLPSRWANAIDSKAESTTGLVSIFFMAFTLVLVSFSCTGPIIGTLLVEAAANDSIIGPAVGMGGFALGLALPFGLCAFFPSLLKEMPRSGSWLNTVKVVLGFIELILSLKFLSVADLAYGWHILDREVFIALWIVLFVLLGLYLLGKLRFPHDDAVERVSVLRFFLAVASLSFAVYMLPGLWGAPLKSISAFAPPLSTQDFNLYGGTFREFDNYDEGMAYAREHHKPVLLDFSGYACVNCRKMEGAVFDTEAVRDILEHDYVLIKLMVDDKTPLKTPQTVEENGRSVTLTTVGDLWSYLQRHKFAINTQPLYVLLDGEGRPLEQARSYDENVAEFVAWLQRGLENFNNIN